MVEIIKIIIFILVGIDLFATWMYVSTFISKFPDKNYSILEANPIIRFCWKQFGFNLGMIISSVIIFGLWFFILSRLAYNWEYFAAGVLSMMLIYHLLNWLQLRAL